MDHVGGERGVEWLEVDFGWDEWTFLNGGLGFG